MQNNSKRSKNLFSTLNPKQKWHWLLILLIYSTFLNATAQISIPSLDVPHAQDFNVLDDNPTTNPWTSNLTIPGWYAANTVLNDFVTNYRGDNNTNGSLYSYGSSESDRALGSLTTNASGDIVFGAHFKNTSGNAINSVVLSFHVEHWRRSNTDLIGHQRTKVSYSIATDISVTPAYLFDDNNFIEVPEAYLISIDTISTEASLNGNSVSATLSVTIPLSIPNGSEFFLRFDDDNIVGETDIGMAVDDLQINFSGTTVPRIVVSSGYTVFSYLDMGIVQDIPKENSNYIVPSPGQLTDWQQILESFYDDGNLNDVNASSYGYEAIEFTDLIGTNYQVLRKQNYSGFFWGTYVKLIFPVNNSLLIQSPHAIDDNKTGTQGAAVFYLTEATGLMLAGISRCASSEFSACDGMTSSCSDDDTDEPFRKSDVAHESNSIFQLATTILATLNPSLVFVQLHGFGQDNDDPDFIISCGTENAQLKSVPDYAVLVRENLLNLNSQLDIQITHVDSYSEFGAETNVQGRYLNLYPDNICTDDTDPTTVTNRFLHIEQFLKYRNFPNYYGQLAIALSQSINDNAYERSILINDEFFFHSEEFSNLYALNKSDHTWGNNLHVQGWYAAGTVDGLFSIYHIAHGQLNHGGIYSFGPNGSAERAFGSIATTEPASAGDIAYGVLFKNTSGVVLLGVELEYDSEQWRDSDQDGVQTVELSYRIDNEIDLHPDALLDNNAYTHFPNGDLHSSNAGGAIGHLDGNTNSVHVNVTIPIELNAGQEIFIRFFDIDNTGFDKAMAIDNFNASFSSEPPMPVEWSYFKVSTRNGRPFLEWGADYEDECKTYEVLRSQDEHNFENITDIPCKGDRLTNHYDYTDYSAIWKGNVYYKIAQYDESGEVTYTPVKSFSSISSAKPNVYYKRGELIVDADKDAKLKSVAVMDFMGRMLFKGSPTIENNSHYTMACPLPPNQLLIVQLVFDSNTYVMHMRTDN